MKEATNPAWDSGRGASPLLAADKIPAPAAAPASDSPLEGAPHLVKVPEPTIERLSTYLQCVRTMRADGVPTASSSEIAGRTGINAAQFRKDLSYFGEFGTPGLGYDVAELEAHLSRIMGLDRHHDMLLIGAGNLGSALSHYMGFDQRGFRIVAVFDADPNKIGKTLAGCTIRSINDIAHVNEEIKAQIGVITVPGAAAQEVADKLVAAGVVSILNFAPVSLMVRPGIILRNVDLTSQLEVLSYYLRAQ
jgi:redox-sensing transcriptional repressor